MKITNVRARVFEWKGKTVPPQGNFCSNAMDLVYDKHASGQASANDTMNAFRFHGWTVVEVETDTGIVGLGNVALAPRIAKLRQWREHLFERLRQLGNARRKAQHHHAARAGALRWEGRRCLWTACWDERGAAAMTCEVIDAVHSRPRMRACSATARSASMSLIAALSSPTAAAPGRLSCDPTKKAARRPPLSCPKTGSDQRVPVTSTSTRRSGCRQATRAAVRVLPLQSPGLVTGWVSPLPVAEIFELSRRPLVTR